MEPYLRFRWRRARRRLKKLSRQIRTGGVGFLHTHLWLRFRGLRRVRRFLLSWGALCLLAFGGLWVQSQALEEYYLADGPDTGGVYTEGVVGSINLINPIFPDNNATRSASRLVFNGLLRYNAQGQLEEDLAVGWDVNEDGTIYSVALREDVRWHDGERLTAEDVEFTLRRIRNPDTRSPLREEWKDVSISVVDTYSLEFELPNPYAPFPHSLTIGILPSHLLGFYDPAQLRLAAFNQNPIGTGPFMFKQTLGAQAGIELAANENYFRGAPKVDRFILRAFDDHEELLEAFRNREVVAAAGLRATEAGSFRDLGEAKTATALLSHQVFAFFQTESNHLSDRRVRQALVRATSPHRLHFGLSSQYARADGPLLAQHLGYSSRLTQLSYDLDRSKRLLESADWQLGEDELRTKDGEQLELELLTQDTGAFPAVASILQEAWAQVGVKLNVRIVPGQELEQQHIPARDYDVLLLSSKLGADPDVFSFWHSSQANPPGLNLSRYRSSVADVALEDGRTRLDEELRAAKYHTFLSTWRNDAPAVALYRPQYFYLMRQRVNGFNVEQLINVEDRYWNVEEWTVRTTPTLQRQLP